VLAPAVTGLMRRLDGSGIAPWTSLAICEGGRRTPESPSSDVYPSIAEKLRTLVSLARSERTGPRGVAADALDSATFSKLLIINMFRLFARRTFPLESDVSRS